MCGINGVLALEGGTFVPTDAYVTRMRDEMAHRGPDGAGTWISPDRQIGLGHRRLSIIDLSSAADQPMSNEDETIWVAFNGEIYNHAEIKAELEQLGGYRWKTDHSDTEVIVHAFEQWGIDCIHRFRGMFAIALWDSRSSELWLVRDRLGIKPLYYSQYGGRFAFASEIKALLADPERTRSVDVRSLYHYLTFLTAPAPATMFEGIHKLPPATWMRVRADGRVESSRYWDSLDHAEGPAAATEEEVVERLQALLRESVALRKVSDVPIGVFLSGGVDSSANAALFSEGEERPVKTFTIGYDADYATYTNELHFAREMAERIGADHHERILNMDDLLAFLPKMIHLQDEPLGDPVCFPVYAVSELAREKGVTVCQVGEGSDELFWGYPGWRRALLLQRLDDLPVPRALKRAGLAGLRLLGKEEAPYYEWLRRGAMGEAIFWGGTDAFTEPEKQRLLTPKLREQLGEISSWDIIAPYRARFEEKAWEPSPVQWMAYFDLNVRLPELMLMRVDKMSMGVALEARVPFLDHRFVEYAMTIPQAMKTRDGELKHILKAAVRGLIPDKLIDRPKQGFHVPVHEWFFDKLGDVARAEIREFCRRTGYLDETAALRVLDNKHYTRAWYLLNLALWWKHYIAQEPLPDFTKAVGAPVA